MCKELGDELERGTKAATALIEHLQMMDAANGTIPITVDGTDYIVTVANKTLGPRYTERPCTPDCPFHTFQVEAEEKPKVGMYNQTPKVTIGNMIIREFTIPVGDSLWIEEVGEEGMQCKKVIFEPVLKKFFDEVF